MSHSFQCINSVSGFICDRLCGLVVRVPGCRSRGPGSIPGATRFLSSGSGTGSTQHREYTRGIERKGSGFGLEIHEKLLTGSERSHEKSEGREWEKPGEIWREGAREATRNLTGGSERSHDKSLVSWRKAASVVCPNNWLRLQRSLLVDEINYSINRRTFSLWIRQSQAPCLIVSAESLICQPQMWAIELSRTASDNVSPSYWSMSSSVDWAS
jgi:hypothetical protein